MKRTWEFSKKERKELESSVCATCDRNITKSDLGLWLH